MPLSLFQGHTSWVTHIDWSRDNVHLRTNAGDYELLFCNEPPPILVHGQSYNDLRVLIASARRERGTVPPHHANVARARPRVALVDVPAQLPNARHLT